MRHKKRIWRKCVAAFMVVLTVAVALLWILDEVYKIRNIEVIGNRMLSREDVILASGVELGDDYLSVTKAKLKENLETNRYIRYIGHDFDYSGTLVIQIDERQKAAVVQMNGWDYITDKNGMVLEYAAGIDFEKLDVPRVIGMKMTQGMSITAGNILPVRDESQLAEMKTILETLDYVNMLAQASLVDMTDSGNIKVITEHGATVELGELENLERKLLFAKEVITDRLEMNDLAGAKIDVANNRTGHFIPAVLPTVTPVPTATPAPSPQKNP